LGLSGCLGSPPAIERVQPAKGEAGVAPDAPIVITFDRAMDHQSVESRLEVQPGIPGCSPSGCLALWRDRTLTLAHSDHEFVPNTRYRVVLRPGYHDTAGAVNSYQHSWQFTTEEAPTLRSSTPASGATGVAPDVDIVLQFSRAMLPVGPDQVRIEPAVPFHLAPDPGDAGRIVVSPLRLLRPDTRYTLTVAASLQDVHNDSIGQAVRLTFTTGRVSLERTLAFAVFGGPDQGGQPRRIALLRPPASLSAASSSMRVVYSSALPIRDFDWSAGSAAMYTLEGTAPDTRLVRVDPTTGTSRPVAAGVSWMAASPARDEAAYVDAGHHLHIWRAGVDDTIASAGHLTGPPAWSGDGAHLAFTVDDLAGGANAIAVLDRATLSRYLVAGDAASGAITCPACPDPRWSFDSTTLAFARAGDAGPEVWSYASLAGGGALTKVAATVPAQLAWSSDGSNILGVVATGIESVRARPLPGQAPEFAPIRGSRPGDGPLAIASFDRRLAFVRLAAGRPQLWMMNSDGTGLIQLTHQTYEPGEQLPAYGVTLPRWAPAGP
jgi:hypothetical protein